MSRVLTGGFMRVELLAVPGAGAPAEGGNHHHRGIMDIQLCVRLVGAVRTYSRFMNSRVAKMSQVG